MNASKISYQFSPNISVCVPTVVGSVTDPTIGHSQLIVELLWIARFWIRGDGVDIITYVPIRLSRLSPWLVLDVTQSSRSGSPIWDDRVCADTVGYQCALLRQYMIVFAMSFTIRVESDQDLSYDWTPTDIYTGRLTMDFIVSWTSTEWKLQPTPIDDGRSWGWWESDIYIITVCLYYRQRGRRRASARPVTAPTTKGQESCSQAVLTMAHRREETITAWPVLQPPSNPIEAWRSSSVQKLHTVNITALW